MNKAELINFPLLGAAILEYFFQDRRITGIGKVIIDGVSDVIEKGLDRVILSTVRIA